MYWHPYGMLALQPALMFLKSYVLYLPTSVLLKVFVTSTVNMPEPLFIFSFNHASVTFLKIKLSIALHVSLAGTKDGMVPFFVSLFTFPKKLILCGGSKAMAFS